MLEDEEDEIWIIKFSSSFIYFIRMFFWCIIPNKLIVSDGREIGLQLRKSSIKQINILQMVWRH